MTALTFIRRGLVHYRGSYFGVLAGAALGAMVLLGALFAGDSVKETLRQLSSQRIGLVESVVVGGENFVTQDLAKRINGAPVLQLQAQVNAGKLSTGQVDLLGVDEQFWLLAPSGMEPLELKPQEFAINRTLARQLGAKEGDSIVARLRKPGLLSHDAPLSGESDELITLRGTVAHILSDTDMGRFSLRASQLPTPLLCLPIERLAESIERPGKTNLILRGAGIDPEQLKAKMALEDYGLRFQPIPLAQSTELRTDRIFLPPAVEVNARELYPEARTVLTYLANTIAANSKETPYSMVTGIDAAPFLPGDLKDDEIVLNSWEADDLEAKPGDEVRLTYYVLGSNNRLDEESATFTVRGITPLEGLAADKLWMPDFPGIAEAEDNADWTPGLPLDLGRIREKDETYWDDHRGTPKAFITHRAAAKLWENRWGSSTSLRFRNSDIPVADFESKLLDTLDPSDAGLTIRDVQAEATAAAASPVDIATLFLSMSFFLIVAAVGLTAMLFRFNVEQRNHESGLLAALGIPARKLLRWRLAEGAVVVTLGSICGWLIAIAYTRGLLLFLETIWSTGGDRVFRFHMSPVSTIAGTLGFVMVTMITIWWVTRRQSKRSASLRLETGTEEVIRTRKSKALMVAVGSAVVGVAALAASKVMGPQGAFFLAGFSFLIAGLAFFTSRLKKTELLPEEAVHPKGLALLNTSRRPTRSLVVTSALASGVFLVVSVAAFQKHGGGEWKDPKSGAGGFSFWIETTSPVNRSAAGDGLDLASDPPGTLLPFRVGTGDDASCFNLNAVARPRLLATKVSELEGRFRIKDTIFETEPGWADLERPGREATLTAFVDETTLLWVLKKKLGDTITYTDDFGNELSVQIAGTLADSVFQGSLVVDEQAFLRHFPSTVGYRLFLAEGTGLLDSDRTQLQRAFTDLGASISTTSERLAAFHGVENTYIAIFHVLGGLGVILGSAGLGLLTARNLAERRSEFDLLRTLGISGTVIRSVIFRESRRYILWGLGVGLVAAVVSILPNLPESGRAITAIWIIGLVVLIAANAVFWAWFAYQRQSKSRSTSI
ncbi:ABC transporter permease [Haloferula helveola]|uniref:ABC transporter permease n=1 Tax=Haloferula helveola TaxID=490095 RepID=A0ABM7RJQ8_9BACT|nr:ABC transporter permease [Haloferula helveola]